MSWWGSWFGASDGGGLTINDGVYVEVEILDVEVFVEASDLIVSLSDNQITVTVTTDEIEIEVNE